MAATMIGLYGVRNFKGKEGEARVNWTRIGTAVPCKDGSWNLLFDYFPLQSGMMINMRAPKAGEGGDGE